MRHPIKPIKARSSVFKAQQESPSSITQSNNSNPDPKLTAIDGKINPQPGIEANKEASQNQTSAKKWAIDHQYYPEQAFNDVIAKNMSWEGKCYLFKDKYDSLFNLLHSEVKSLAN
jgi:hypothetical protein